MLAYDLTRLGDGKLMQRLKSLVEQERATLFELLAHLAEVDQRRLYVPVGYPSMFEYCVRELGCSEDAAYTHIQAARAARKFPVLFGAVADGRLHLTAVVFLAPHFTRDNANELIAAASRKRKSEIVELLAARFPRPDVPEVLRKLPVQEVRQLAPAQVGVPGARHEQPVIAARPAQLVPEPVGMRPRITPLAPELLSHQVPSGDLSQVLAFCLQAGLEKLEKRKFAATNRPRKHQGKATSKRSIPAHVKRGVWSRDAGRCTFISDGGKRCCARNFLEFDHIEPVARGGLSTLDNTRLRCRAHNQYAAELVYGSGFMHEKRRRGHLAPTGRRAGEQYRS